MDRQVYRLTPKPGSLKNLKLMTEALPEPGPTEIQIEVKAIGLNFADVFCIAGLYKAAPKTSFIPGLEFAGVVTKVGKGVTDRQLGDRVFGVTKFGAYVTHINVGSEYVAPIPENWTFEEGAAFPVQALTAYYALGPLGNLETGNTVLIHSAAGGVGYLANRIAKKKGAYTIGTIGSPHKVEFLQKEGFDDYIVRGKDFKAQLHEKLGGRPLDVVLETIGGRIFKDSFDALGPMGRLVSFGSARFAQRKDKFNFFRLLYMWMTRPMVDPMSMTITNRSLMAFNLIYLYERSHLMRRYLNELNALDLGHPHVGHVFPFEKLKESIELFQGGKTIGKVVVVANS